MDSIILSVADACQVLTFGIAFLGFIPQWSSILRNKSAKDVSLKSWLIWSICWTLSLFYAWSYFLLAGTGWALALTSSLSSICTFSTLYLIFIYQRKEKISASESTEVRDNSELVRASIQAVSDATEDATESLKEVIAETSENAQEVLVDIKDKAVRSAEQLSNKLSYSEGLLGRGIRL